MTFKQRHLHNDQNIWLFTNDLRITTKVYDFLTKTLNNDENKRCFNKNVQQRRNDFHPIVTLM
jgi:hypothetical protein